MSETTTVSRSASRSRGSSIITKNDERDSFSHRFPRIETMDDVITNFFNQIVQYVIDDMVVIEGRVDDNGSENKANNVVKDYKELQLEDLAHSEIIGASGTKVTLTQRSPSQSIEKKWKKSPFSSKLDIIKEEGSDNSSKTSTMNSSLQEPQMDEERQVRITFTNGNVYEGTISKRIMNGNGRYEWTDGTIYEGHFKDGFPTGFGQMILPDLSQYEGQFNQGSFHGKGFLNIVSTPTFYSGQWENGMKHGQGWLLYEPGDWYEGGWVKDLKDGFGLRHYKNGAKYRGMWREGKYDGDGIMIWDNSDYYKGQWSTGKMHGEGEYIWRAFYNDSFAFPVQNIYRGSWQNGKRSGEGVMIFGDDTGIKLKGTWDQDFKHGSGNLICGNGRVADYASLFKYDKPKHVEFEGSAWSLKVCKILEIPIFTAPEYVDISFYVDKILSKLENITKEKLKIVKLFEERCIQNIIIKYLPPLRELYQEYASIAAKKPLSFDPIMVRLFLWQLYKDKEIWKRGISLAEVDIILADNSKSCLDTVHNPFEPIYFWQFLMSLIGTALTTCSLEDMDEDLAQGVSASVVKKFFDEIIFAKVVDHKSKYKVSEKQLLKITVSGCLLLNYLDMAPIKAIYLLYKEIGEPHSARTFLRRSCIRKHETLCHLDLLFQRQQTKLGSNLVPLDQHVQFENVSGEANTLDEKLKHKWTNLYDFRHLGPRNIVQCLAKACPLIMIEGLIVNIDYPLTFLEFYETLLYCIFLTLKLEMKKEEKILSQSVTPTVSSTHKKHSITLKHKGNRSFESKKPKDEKEENKPKDEKEEKKPKKRKKKV